jgi:hypothetical protein
MLSIQSKIIQIAQDTLFAVNEQHIEPTTRADNDSFTINSWVLVQYPKSRMNMRHPTKLDYPGEGPYRVSAKV